MITMLRRRKRSTGWLAVAAGAVVVLTAGCAGGAGGDDDDGGGGGGENSGTVTVGFISPVTGFAAALGTDMKNGWDLYWEQNGDEVGGVTVETVYEDGAGDPDVALTKAQRLVEQEEVDIVAGPVLANTAYAVANYVAGQGIPTLNITGADDLTQRQADPLILRAGYTSSQSNFPAGQWAYEQGYRNAVTLCPDYAFGWESCGGFVSSFTAAGGEVSEQLWNPLGTQDFSTYVSQIQSLNPDVVFIGSAGGPDAILFYNSWLDFGAQDIPLVGNCCFADEVFTREVGERAVGVQSFTYWAAGRESAATSEFVEAYEEKHGEIPSLYAAGSYLMAQIVARTLEETGGTVDESFMETAGDLTFDDSVYGPISFDDYNNIVGNVYLTEVTERDGGGYWNVPAETFEEQSQFWDMDPEEYLQQPVFSRDHTSIDQ
jgi:branched-chain amino acid transport system substrate-binding protein